MFSYLVKRILQSILVMLAVSLISFILFAFVGDPVSSLVGQDTTLEERAKIREALGLNDPFYQQFLSFIGKAIQGDFGHSWFWKKPVHELIGSRLPVTLELVFVSAILAMVMGLFLGVVTAIYRHHWAAKALLTISLVGVSLPTFLIGIGLIYLFSVILGWLPSFGRGETADLGVIKTSLLTRDGWAHIIMPAVTLSLFQMTLVLRLVRTEMLETLQTDFIKFARARGLSKRAVYYQHALRNTLVPVITIAGLNIGILVAFSIITETVFQYPGVGLMFLKAVTLVDIPVMSAYLMLVALIFVTINFIVDVLYFVVDPRLRTQTS
ncbi:MAG: ABC transporter permease [Alphaproteobacteria bacterium]